MATVLWASAVKCNLLKQKNTLMMSLFCNMCPIQLTVADIPIASSSIPVTVDFGVLICH